MEFEIEDLILCAKKLRSDKITDKKKIAALQALLKARVTISQLDESKIGRAVKKLVKKEGEVKDLAELLINKWKKEISDYCESKNIKEDEFKNQTNNGANSNEIIKNNKNPTVQSDFQSSATVKYQNPFTPTNLKSSPPDFDNNNSGSVPNLPILPIIDTNSLSVSQEMWGNQQNRESNTNIPLDESNLTSRYESQKRIWIPKSKNAANIVDDREKEYINGVSCDEIAMYDWKKLKSFENNDKKIMKKTDNYWEKLFRGNHKSAVKREDETWRNAYLRIESELEAKFKLLAAKINEKNRSQIKAQPQAKVLKGPLIPQNNKKRRRF